MAEAAEQVQEYVWEIPEALEWLYTAEARYKVAYGGRGGGRSWSCARALLQHSLDEPQRILCARETMVSLDESVKQLLVDQMDLMGVRDAFEVQRDRILCYSGSQFLFAGIRTNPREVKSKERIKRCWVEEAEAVSDESLEILLPTIRDEGSEVWFSFNPRLRTDPVWKRFVVDPPPNAIVRKVSFRDNPWFPAVLEAERLELLRRDPALYQHVWEGEPGVTGICFFQFDVLKGQEQYLEPPKAVGILEQSGPKVRFVPHDHGYLEVWREPQQGLSYVVGADVAEGKAAGADRGVAQVLSRGPLAWQEARLRQRDMDASEFGRACVRLASWYEGAALGIERNSLGLAAVMAARDTGYTGLYYHIGEDPQVATRQPRIGWETTVASRPVLLADLSQGLREQSVRVRSADTLDEHSTFIRSPSGKPEAMKGCRDDEVLSLGISVQMLSRTTQTSQSNDQDEEDYGYRRGGTRWMAS